jgi:hypothetical protein
MNRFATVLLATAVALALSAPAAAQKKGAAPPPKNKKLYRWVDADGKVQISDTLPPEQVGTERTEISAGTGRTTATIARELTPEEKAAAAAEALRNQDEAERLAEQKRNEDAMLASYLTEDDLKRAYGERISLLKQTLESTDVSLMSLRTSLAMQLADASESELAGKKVDNKRVGKIRELHDELLRQRQFQANRHVELMSLDAEFGRMLERYRVRRSEDPTAIPPAGAAPVAPPPH